MEQKSRAQQTAEYLYNQIVIEKHFAPGEKLPNEVELSQALGVSRATLREAFRALTTQGILEVRRGRGTFVSGQIDQIEDFGFSNLEQIRGQLRDLFELRSIFEPQAARLACQRATQTELDEILRLGEVVAQHIRTEQDRTLSDQEFHAAIVRATHNEFMMRLLPMINQAVATAIDSSDQGEQLSRFTLQDHALLLDFFRKRDAAGAEHAMVIHIRHSMDIMGLDGK